MKGNNPEAWQKLLTALDEKLQMNLLDHLGRVSGYHIEDDILFIDPGTPEEIAYFKKDSVFHQLELMAQDILRVDKVKIKEL